MNYLGDILDDGIIDFGFTTSGSDGAVIAPSSAFDAADLKIYKSNSATEKTTTNGVTLTSPFDSVVGLHQVRIDTGNDTGDGGFWVTGADYIVVLDPNETVDSVAVVSIVASFSIENRNMRGTDSSLLAADKPLNFEDMAITDTTGRIDININNDKTLYTISGSKQTLDALNDPAATDIVVGGPINTTSGAVDVVTDISNLVGATILELNGDAAAAANLEAMYNGTGYTDPNGPSKQSQLSSLANVGSAINTSANGDNFSGPIHGATFTGTQSDTFAFTVAIDSDYHEMTDSADVIDIVYTFNVTSTGVASSINFTGYLNGSNDILAVQAWDFNALQWVQIGQIEGQVSSVDVVENFALFTDMTGPTGVESGDVLVRIVGDQSSPNLFTNQIYVSYSVVNQTVGYSIGAVWIDAVNGVPGDEPFVNGTADNPVDNLEDAIAIAANVGIRRFAVAGGSNIQFLEDHENEVWFGDNWSLDFNGNSISGSVFFGSDLEGTATGVNTPRFETCSFGNVELPPCKADKSSGFTGTFICGSAGDYSFIDCVSLLPGATVPIFDLNASIGATNLNLRDWKGGASFLNIQAGDLISIEGMGGVVTFNGNGGNADIRGVFEDVIDLSSQLITVNQVGMINRSSLGIYEEGAIHLDTNGSNAGTVTYVDGTVDNPCNSLVNATTVAASVGVDGLKKFFLTRGSVITLDQSYIGFTFAGNGATINLNGQDIGNCAIERQFITGSSTGSGTISLEDCSVNDITIPGSTIFLLRVVMSGSIVLLSAATYSLASCLHGIEGSPPTFDFGVSVGATTIICTNWGGDIILDNMGQNGTDFAIIEGTGKVTINSSCISGTVIIRGNIELVDNGSGTVVEDARIDAPVIKGIADTAISDAALATATSMSQAINDIANVQTEIDSGVYGLSAIKDETTLIVADTNELVVDDIPTLIGNLNNLSDAEILAEVNSALNEAIPELGVAAPTSTPNLRTGLILMYMALRNKTVVQTSGTDALEIHNTSGTLITSKLITDDGDDYEEAQMS